METTDKKHVSVLRKLPGKLFWNFLNNTVVQLPVRNHRDLQETVTQSWLSDLSHMNSPPLAHAELSSALFTLPLSLSSALRVISSAIWSIASPMKNALQVTNLFTSSQKDVCVQHRGGLESVSNAVSAAGLGWEQPLALAAVCLGKAESIQDKLSFTFYRVHLACCRLHWSLSNVLMTLAKTAKIRCY